MKKIVFLLLMSLLCFGAFAQTDEEKTKPIQTNERTMEVIPTLSASGNGDGIALDSELIIAKKFTLKKNWFLYGQLGGMYNVYKMKFADEWQLGFEPMVGIGTNRFRLSGFLNGLTVKAFDTGKMPFIEGGVRLNLTPWKTVWISLFSTWPISDPVFVQPLEDSYLENDEGIFLINSELWAQQIHSYGADIDFGIGKKLIVNLDGFAIDWENYQVGAGLQYQLFKNKPWVIGGNVFYTNFADKDYFYIHNIFPGMFGDDLKGYTFKIGISNNGGLGETDYTNQLTRIAQSQYYSPVKKKIETKQTNIGGPFKFDPCSWGGKCLDFFGALCITQGKPPYKIFVNWGDNNTEQFTILEMGRMEFRHHYFTEGEKEIMISGMDALGKTFSYIGKFLADDCTPDVDPCANVYLTFGADKTAVTPGKTVNFNWDADGADAATFDGADVALKVPSYPVIFNTLGTFQKTVKAYKDGKVCKEKTITITVTQCPTAEVLSLSADPKEVVKGGSSTISWVVKNWKTVTLNGVDVTSLTNGSGVGSKTFTGITAATDYNLVVNNDCPSSAKASVRVMVKEDACTGVIITIGGKDTDTTRTVTIHNGGTITNSFTISAVGKQDSTTKATNSTTFSLAAGVTKVITVTYDKNVTIIFNGVPTSFPAVPMCVYYLYITANCNK